MVKCKHEWIYQCRESAGLGEYYYCKYCLSEAMVHTVGDRRDVELTKSTGDIELD